MDNMEITFEQVIEWIERNKHKTELMDSINRLSYAGTRKFKEKNEAKHG